ncbi:HAD family hydrolase [Lachnospiraceae bacterium 45-W7]
MKTGVLFDLDGTLWDSSKEVAASWKEALEKRPEVHKEITTELIQSVMGKSMYEIADILFAGYDLPVRRALLDYCCQEENKYILRHGGQLLEGLEETLNQLKEQGYELFIVSNCQEGYIEAFLQYHGLRNYFKDFECFGATGREKGYNIRLVAERNHLEQAVYVGDTQGDYVAAAEAGLSFIHARTGYGNVEAEVRFITRLIELPEMLKTYFAGGHGTIAAQNYAKGE